MHSPLSSRVVFTCRPSKDRVGELRKARRPEMPREVVPPRGSGRPGWLLAPSEGVVRMGEGEGLEGKYPTASGYEHWDGPDVRSS